MTLADWIRKYLEDRRKACEQKAQYLDLPSNNVQFYTDHNEDDNVITLSNDHFFSNDIEPKPKDQSQGSKGKTYQKSVGVSRSSRIRTLPDGTVEVETIIRDSNGKEERHVTYQKDGKKYTTIFRKNPSGEEEVEEKVGEGTDIEIFPVNPLNPERFSRSRPSSDSGYDYWYDKFFNSRESKPEEWSNDVKTFDPSTNIDEQMENILRRFGFGGPIGSVPGIPRNRNVEDEPNVNDGTFTEFNDSAIHEELQKMFESFGIKDFSPDNNQQKKGNNRNLERQMDKIFKNVAPPRPPTMFEQFSEDAYLELPEDNTPLDKFIDKDEERLGKLKSKWQKSNDVLEKLEKYFAGKSDNSLETDIYSDIEDPKDIDLSLLLPQPQPQPEFPPSLHNFSDILRKTIDPNSLFKSGNIQTHMYFGDGKRRTESIGKDKDGNTEKNILYEIGDKQYNVKIVTNRFGVEVKREKSHNFPDREFTKFKKQWGKAFVSDFMDD